MAKISVFGIEKATIEAKAFLVGEQYAFAKATVEKFKGKIGKNAEGKMRATFASVKNANACKKELDAWWDSKKTSIGKATVRVNKTTPAPAKGKSNFVTVTVDGVAYQVDKANLVPTAPAKKSAPKNAKGNGFDYGKIKGKTNADKNKALHAALVKAGMKDSRAKDYQAIWTNRPWAK